MSQSTDDLASRILERAQMAQMTRQLKLGLSQVPRANRNATQGKREGDEELLANETSPQKKAAVGNSAARRRASPRKAEPATIQRPLRASGAMALVPSSPKAHAGADSPLRAMPSTPGRSTNTSGRFLTTPNRKQHGRRNDAAATDNNAGADLLMYLATSPYTKSSGATIPTGSMHQQQKLNSLMKIPTTPSSSSYMNQHAGSNDDAIRLSSMKPTLSSPQSTFKVPQLVSNATNNPSSTLSYHDVLMESPSLYLNAVQQSAAAVSPQKRKVTPSHGQSAMSTSIPTTPSREIASTVQHIQGSSSGNSNTQGASSAATTTSNTLGLPSASTQGNNMSLLKTPNFNMGDYIHNLFSPSPNVPAPQGSIATSMLGSMRKTSVSSATGSTSSGSGNNAFDGLLAATTGTAAKQQHPISTAAGASSLLEKGSGEL